MKLIDKDALVAEIKKHQAIWDGMDDDYCKGQRLAYSDVISFLDTLEVKEVDLEKAIDGLTVGWIEGEEYGELQNINTRRCVTLGEVKEAMRCMFELGLNAKVVWSEDI